MIDVKVEAGVSKAADQVDDQKRAQAELSKKVRSGFCIGSHRIVALPLTAEDVFALLNQPVDGK